MSLRIIIVGAGLIGPRHAQSVLSNPSTELVALIDPASSAALIASQLQTKHFPSIQAMLAAIPKPDAAIICTPNHTHVPIATELLTHGIHILIEKPLSDSLETAQSLLRFARRPENSHLTVLVGHHRRFNPYVEKTKQILESNSLGTPIAVNGLWTLYKPPSYFAPPTDWRRTFPAGGVIPINLVHDIDTLQYVFGPITRVHAEKTPRQRANPPHEVEEGAALILRFASGVVGTFLVCDTTPSPYNFEMGTGENPLIPPPPSPGPLEGGGGGSRADFYRIFGSEACLSVPDMTRWSYDGRAEKSWTEELVVERFEIDQKAAPFDLQLEHFVEVIAGRERPRCSGEDGLRALMVCDGVRRALETGDAVDLPLV
ncbi:Gfo/Idh/MocA family protein [Aspergillus novofumigatus IBT 16806]|uniref:Quinate utilization oxidoreductase QutH n=1 Tax=Aspergillus novofumigatus (strain IBT 16806) TaxID=1392255 RepID=A0A2I1C9D4_ASPN1|nr:quinate utilization oxidoreductase QutH [Aspergillus novofumigatus IBT 16806]PKX94215.1 quinate utilization oxidoreductase QutH [Aspergillus novofumigatus IBT 16806]